MKEDQARHQERLAVGTGETEPGNMAWSYRRGVKYRLDQCQTIPRTGQLCRCSRIVTVPVIRRQGQRPGQWRLRICRLFLGNPVEAARAQRQLLSADCGLCAW